jgi:putative aminopeptidase FrvX
VTLPALLEELLRAPGPSGGEDAVAAIVRREALQMGAEGEGDVLGSRVVRVRGTGDSRLLAVFAHADQIGMVVRDAGEDGLLRVATLSSWEAAAAARQRVLVLTSSGSLPGVVVADCEGEPEWEDLRIDFGAADRDAALGLVRPGDAAVLDAPPVELAGGRVLSPSLDDRAGLFAALEAIRRLGAEPPVWDVALVASSQEETSTHAGAAVAARRLRPDAALVVEVTDAGDAPGKPAWGPARLGNGPAIFRGPVVSPVVADRLAEVADRLGLPYTFESGRSTASDADAVFLACGGIPVGVASIPLRYMHTAGEVAQLSDVEAVSRLVEGYARSLEPDCSFVR